VLVLVKSLVAGGFYIIYAKFDSYRFCKFKFFTLIVLYSCVLVDPAKCQGNPDPSGHPVSRAGHPVPDPLLSFCRIF
jgi:hypothetical protein